MHKIAVTYFCAVLIGAAVCWPVTPAAGQDREELDRRVAESPDDVALRVAAGKAWLQLAQASGGRAVGAAAEHLDRALELAPGDPQILALHGSLLALKGREASFPITKMRYVQKGLKELDRAIELAPADFGIRWQRGATCLNLPAIFQRAATAVEDFSQLHSMAEQAPEQVSPAQVAAIELNLARALMMVGEDDTARTLLGNLTAALPDTPTAEQARALLAEIDD